jgi:hypothetical protein
MTTPDNSPEVVAGCVQSGSRAFAAGTNRPVRITSPQRITRLWQFIPSQGEMVTGTAIKIPASGSGKKASGFP